MLVHACCVAYDAGAVLILGASQSGKTSLICELIAQGAMLVADDQVHLENQAGKLVASSPPALRGLVELSGIGVFDLSQHCCDSAPVAFAVEVVEAHVERVTEPAFRLFEGVEVPLIYLERYVPSNASRIQLLLDIYRDNPRFDRISIAKPD